jgi:hypothetical protein
MEIIPAESIQKLERQRSLFTPEARDLMVRVYATIKTDKLTALAARFRQAQEAVRQASADADYLFLNGPRRRSELVKAFERQSEAEEEMMDAFEAFLAECTELERNL